jgi:hypothetical protein
MGRMGGGEGVRVQEGRQGERLQERGHKGVRGGKGGGELRAGEGGGRDRGGRRSRACRWRVQPWTASTRQGGEERRELLPESGARRARQGAGLKAIAGPHDRLDQSERLNLGGGQ